ncbi:hypothetical protein ACWERV_32285 [Streptomyces sp. NPDC004031]
MTSPEARISAICAEFLHDSAAFAGWSDSSSLRYLLAVARSFGVLTEVDAFHVFDEDDRDLVLVSVELRPGVFAHAEPVPWQEMRPLFGTDGASAISDVLARLGEISGHVRASHGDGERVSACPSAGSDR